MAVFMWKVPKITVSEAKYGEYLMRHPDTIPAKDISLDTEGYIVEETDYGTAEYNIFPFQRGDWIEKEYVHNNFVKLQ